MAFSVIFVHFVFAPKNHISFLQSCAFGFAVIIYNNAPKDIEYLQTTIAQYAANQIDKDTCIDRLIGIYKYNGHALGFYISNQIIKAGLRDEMIKEFHNPYEFFRLYSLTLPKDEKALLNDDFLLFLKAETEQYY